MKIGLYIELARKGYRARRQISERHVRATKEDMLKFRNNIIKQSGALTNSSIIWSDFTLLANFGICYFMFKSIALTYPLLKKYLTT